MKNWTFVGSRMELALNILGHVNVSNFVIQMARVTTV
jgi:hypothetical protein